MLELINVDVSLNGDHGKIDILKNINLKLDNKKIYVMTGPNGGGKSSIAKVIMGIFTPTNGKILLNGVDIAQKSITERAQLGVGYAFQQPPRFKGLKVHELLELSAGKTHTCNACNLLYDVGLCAQDYMNREIDTTFSGGELKRVEIASILARDLKVALFDEPEAGIDLWSFQRLTETFENMNRNTDTTIVIISHQERILRLADEVIMIADGTVSEITSQEKVLSAIEQFDKSCRCSADCEREGYRNVNFG
ncbi:MAG: ATP-binding cassette domain-containing protein [Eubacteriaceae bacterium]|nr:ATP-binding cassette domain-containing protein [Eubacteriaceae bacterium]